MLFEIHNKISIDSIISIFNDSLLIPSCRYNVAFWKLYLYYLLYQHYINCIQFDDDKDLLINNDDNNNNLSRYQKQRLKRDRQLRMDCKQKSIDRLKNLFEIAIQTVSISKMLYLYGLDVIVSFCDDNDMNDYIQYIQSKYLNFQFCYNYIKLVN